LLFHNVFALAVTPSQIDFTDYGKSSIVVFNTEDYVKDFSVQLTSEGFSVDKSSLRIPPRSKDMINVTSSCNDCEAKLYVRELSNSNGIRIEPAVVVRLSSGTPGEDEDDFDVYAPENEVTSLSFFDVKKPEILAFMVISSIILASAAFFFGRKFYIKRFTKKSNAGKKKWLKKLF